MIRLVIRLVISLMISAQYRQTDKTDNTDRHTGGCGGMLKMGSDVRRAYVRFLKIEAKERMIDLLMIAFPIFVVVGLIAVSVKFWGWALGLI